ncbi:MAG: ribonuclease III [Bacilli bacterium]|nr:ribonuclease III [Bacilli bacterium]
MASKNIKSLFDELGIKVKNEKLYLQALTHPSFNNEHHTDYGNYQRLEFLGDAVIQLVISKFIYVNYKDMDEGDMSLLRSNLVREESLAKAAKMIDLGSYIQLGVGEEKSGGRNRLSLLCDVFEALNAAIYLDLGIEKSFEIVNKMFANLINIYGMDSFLELKDSKTKLQELVQADKKRTLNYITVDTKGPANQPIFEMVVTMDDIVLGRGFGHSKKEAEQMAAKDALNKMVK